MNENANNNGSGTGGFTVVLMENDNVKEMFDILQENGKDTSELAAIINPVNDMEGYIKTLETKLEEMKLQLDEMKEIQNHPIKTALQNTIKALETKIAELKEQLGELKTNIIEGCKNAVAAFKENGAAALDKIASFFNIKGNLQAIKNNTIQSSNNCDKAVAKIEAFSQEYHKAGRAFKNMARVAVGKKPIDAVKESGKLAKVISAPYKAAKTCQTGLRKQVDKIITSLDKLEQNVEAKRGEKAVKPKKPTLAERLDEKKKEIKERELEAPPKDRVKVKGVAEI